MDRGLSRKGRKRGRVHIQSVSERKPDDAAFIESDRLGCGAYQGLLFQGTVPSFGAPARSAQSDLGSGSSDREGDLAFDGKAATAVVAVLLTFALAWLLWSVLIRRLGWEARPD